MPAPSAPTDSWSRALLLCAVFVGLVVRVAAVRTLGPHVDEAESVLGARMVATTGLPILPSGLVFLQGLTTSYLLPLFDRAADPLDFSMLRGLSALAGTATVYASYHLARTFGAPPLLASLVAMCVALDPQSIQWSAHVRPYAPLQLLSVVMVTLWARALDTRNAWRNVTLSLVFAVGVFTHVGIALLVPGMALVTLARHGRTLLAERRDLTVVFASFFLPVLIFFGINTAAGASSSGAHRGPSFIGDHTLALSSLLSPQLDPWRALFQPSAMGDFMPFLVVAGGTVLLMRRPDRSNVALLGVYAVPVLLIAALSTDAFSRYLLHIQPMSYLLIGLGAIELERMGGWPWRALAAAAGLATLDHGLSGTYGRLARPYVDPDYTVALRWLEGQHAPGEKVLASVTSLTWFSTIPQADVWFLAGAEGSERTTRYVRTSADGTLIDYWSGVPAITSTSALCGFLEQHPSAWLVVDDERMRSVWAYAGPMQDVIRGASVERFRAQDSAGIYHALPRKEWSEKAVSACALSDGSTPLEQVQPVGE